MWASMKYVHHTADLPEEANRERANVTMLGTVAPLKHVNAC